MATIRERLDKLLAKIGLEKSLSMSTDLDNLRRELNLESAGTVWELLDKAEQFGFAGNFIDSNRGATEVAKCKSLDLALQRLESGQHSPHSPGSLCDLMEKVDLAFSARSGNGTSPNAVRVNVVNITNNVHNTVNNTSNTSNTHNTHNVANLRSLDPSLRMEKLDQILSPRHSYYTSPSAEKVKLGLQLENSDDYYLLDFDPGLRKFVQDYRLDRDSAFALRCAVPEVREYILAQGIPTDIRNCSAYVKAATESKAVLAAAMCA